MSFRLNNGLFFPWLGLDFSPLGPRFSLAAPSIAERRGALPCALGLWRIISPRFNLHDTLSSGLNRTYALIF